MVFGLLAAGRTGAQDYPQIESLGGAGHSYAVGDVDTVNRFNGNLMVRIPLASYDVGAHLSYDFTLVYNSSGVHKGLTIFTDAFRPKPHPDSNAGAGWRWSLGDLREDTSVAGDPFFFIDSGGGAHRFHESLHPWAGDGSPQTDYTRDSSYLRMKLINSTRRDVEHPDGRVFEFFKNSTSPPKWRLTKIHDRFGHAVTISYGSNVVTVSDTLGRSHTVHFSPGDGILLPDYVNHFDLAGPSGSRAHWDLSHVWRDTWSCTPPGGEDPGSPLPYSMPLLYNVSQPGGLENPWQMGTASNPAYGGGCALLTELRLPTRGLQRWTWQSWGFPRFAIFPEEPVRWVPGVRERQLLTSSGDLVGAWKYFQTPDGANNRTRTVVQPPSGACEVHHFIAFGNGGWNYGLPFDPAVSNTTAGLKLFLSQEIFPASGASDCTGTKRRSVYVHYEREEGDFSHANERLYARRVHYHDDGNRYVQTRFLDFDGLGHYREAVTTGTIQAGDSRTERTQYNRNGDQVMTVDANGNLTSSYSHPGPNLPWVLAVHSYQQQEEDGVTARQNFDFEGTTGFLNWKRILKTEVTTGTQDVVVTYTRYPNSDPVDRRGQVKDEKWSLGNSAPDLWLLHSYQEGVLSKTEYRTAGGASTGLFQYRATIDQNSSLPTQTIDTSDVVTNFTYDLLGRVTEASPGTDDGGACLTYTYTKASGSTGPKWGVTRRNASCAGNLGQRESWYDPWGRKIHDRILMANGSDWSERRYRYNAIGWLTGEAAWGSDWTDMLDFDAFGRPQTLRPPEGADHDVKLEYTGDRIVRRGVSLDLNGPSPSETRVAVSYEHRDSFGRLVHVDTPAKPNGDNVVTEYQYDVGNRLKRVNMGGQVRTFTYDNRGFLSQECHPEKGVQGNGCVNYTAYDALGNALKKEEGNRTLNSQYDFSGRLTKVWSNWDATVSEWFYDEGDGFGKGKVHLTRRTQLVNFPNDGVGGLELVVQEKINYTGPAGAPTSHSLTFDLPGNRPSYGFLMGTLYNDAGQRTMKAYPQCVGAACRDNDPVRHQYQGWTRGFLKSVDELASSITYHPQGLWSTIVRTNGVTEHQSVWEGQGRPGRIWTTGATDWDGGDGNFDTGAYQYDGVGNVKRMGHDDFGYQASGRLKYAEVACQNSDEVSCHRQRYEYDGAGRGNLFWVETRPRGGAPGVVQWAIDASTNRLDSAVYDVAGNMTQSPYHGQLAYDSQDALVRMGPWGENIPRQFVYTADGERVWTILEDGLQRIYVRDFDGKLLRTYGRSMSPGEWGSPWYLLSSTIWRGSQRLATIRRVTRIVCDLEPECTYTELDYPVHETLDHLGTPRLITREDGQTVRSLDVYPFGGAAPGTLSHDVEFTGHERDNLGTEYGTDDMDYMHARFYSPQMGRFFQVDPELGDPKNPQSWNRYAYVRNNPLRYTDPTGRSISEEALEENERRRAEIEAKLQSIPVIGGLLARAADFLLADVMPKNASELQGAMSSAVLGLARVPGGGAVAGKVGGVAPVRVGQAGEAAVRKAVDIGPSKTLSVAGRMRRPDGVTETVLSEVKNVASQSNTRQLRDFTEIAGNTGRRFDLYVRPDTRLSRPLEEQIERGVINLRTIP